MRNSLLMCVFLLSGFSQLNAQERITSAKPLPIMAWAAIPDGEISQERFLELKEMGINLNLSGYSTPEAMQKALDLAQQVGIKMVTSCPELKTDPEKTAKRFMNHPALAGYFLRDEPVRKDFAELGAWAKKIEAVDRNHFCFVNMISSIHPTNTEALGTATYVEFLKTFVAEIPQQLLSFDFYPILTEGIHERWYEGLELFSTETKKMGKPFWAFALASSYNELHPVPTIPAIRLQLFSDLAYGAQGLEFWAYWMTQGLRCAPIGLDGKRTVVYDRIKSVNNEIQTIAGVFVGSKVIAVQHTGVVIPRGTSRLTTLPYAIKIFETEGPGALVSTLENGDKSYFLVINRDLKQSMPCTILGDETLMKVLKDGSVVKAGRYASTTEIEPGDMAVYQFPTKK